MKTSLKHHLTLAHSHGGLGVCDGFLIKSWLNPREQHTHIATAPFLAVLTTLFASAILLLAPQKSLAQTTLYAGIGRGAGPNKGEVITIDQTTGLGTPLGTGATDPSVGINGLAFDSHGNLFAATISAPVFPNPGRPQGVSTLIRIDPETGEQIAFIGYITRADGSSLIINDLAVQPGTDVLFGISIDPVLGDVYTIDKSSAVATLVGGTGVIAATVGFGPDGTLYATSAIFDEIGFVGAYLNTLDPATAAVRTKVGPFGVHIGGLAVRPTDGVIFASGGAEGSIHTLSEDGVLTLLGLTGLGGVGDIAFIPPPTDKDQCKDGGWAKFGFRNQGQCIQYVNTGK